MEYYAYFLLFVVTGVIFTITHYFNVDKLKKSVWNNGAEVYLILVPNREQNLKIV